MLICFVWGHDFIIYEPTNPFFEVSTSCGLHLCRRCAHWVPLQRVEAKP